MSGEISVGRGYGDLVCRSALLLLTSVLVTMGAHAQEPAEWLPVHRFEGATHLSVDPLGNAYVIDRTRGRLIRVNLLTGASAVVGGAESAIRDPAAVDAGTGLSILVLDRESGRVGRFNRDLAWTGDLETRDGARARDAGTSDRSRAVETSQATAMARLRSGSVALLDSRRAVLRLIDRRGIAAREVHLTDLGAPISDLSDICVDGHDRVVILSLRPASALILDEMGSLLEYQALGDERPVAISCLDAGVMILYEEGFEMLGTPQRQPWPEGIDGTPVAVGTWEGRRLILTERGLFIERLSLGISEEN